MKTIRTLLIAAATLLGAAILPPTLADEADAAQTDRAVNTLLLTQENSAAAVRVDCAIVPQTVVGAPVLTEAPLAYHYTIRYVDWETGTREERNFTSGHHYAQGYACGDVLVLSTSGASGEDSMALAVIDRNRQQVLEDVLLLDGIGYAQRVCWDGVDEEGNACSGSYSYNVWHGGCERPSEGGVGWMGRAHGIWLRLGARAFNSGERCSLSWGYSTESGSTKLNDDHSAKGKPLMHLVGTRNYGSPAALCVFPASLWGGATLQVDGLKPEVRAIAAGLEGIDLNYRDSALPTGVKSASHEQTAALRRALQDFLWAEIPLMESEAAAPATESRPRLSRSDVEPLLEELAEVRHWFVVEGQSQATTQPIIRIYDTEIKLALELGGGQEFYFSNGGKLVGLGSLLHMLIAAQS